MDIIIVGSNETAFQVVDALHHAHNITVMDVEKDADGFFGTFDVQFIQGSGADPKDLLEAGAENADAIIACTLNDDVNVLSCLAAKGLGTKKTMAFVTRGRYIQAFSEEDAIGSTAGAIDRILWPQRTLANQIVDIVRVPRALDSAFFGGGKIKLLEYRLEATDPFTNSKLAKLNLPKDVLVAGAIKQEEFVIPKGETILEVDDKVIFMGTLASMRQLESMFSTKKRSFNVTLIGGGNVGFMVAEQLQGSRNYIKIIELDETRCHEIAAALPHVLVLKGDGTDLDLLEQERIEDADVLVAVTNDDSKNLLVSLLAKDLQIPKVITRVSRASNRRLFQRLGIDSPLAAYNVAVQEVLNWLDVGNIDHLASIEGHADVLELTYPQHGKVDVLGNLDMPENSLVGAILRGDKVIVPKGDTEIKPNDQLFIVTIPANVEAVHRWLEK